MIVSFFASRFCLLSHKFSRVLWYNSGVGKNDKQRRKPPKGNDKTVKNFDELKDPRLPGALAAAFIPPCEGALARAAGAAGVVRTELCDCEENVDDAAHYNLHDLQAAAAVAFSLVDAAQECGGLRLKKAMDLLGRIPCAKLTREGVVIGGLTLAINLPELTDELRTIADGQMAGKQDSDYRVADEALFLLNCLAKGVPCASDEIHLLVMEEGE